MALPRGPIVRLSRSLDAEARSAHQDYCNDLDTGQVIDTGQEALDTGQVIDTHDLMALAFSSEDTSLVIEHHEIHRTDDVEGGRELVTSTLKAFQLRVAVRSADGAPDCDGGILCASLLYEDGGPVQELSATLEPPLLGGRALIEDGVATFRLRITVLSSLCHAKRFRVHVHLHDHPEVCVTSSAVKTITKLRRGSREAREAAREARERALSGSAVPRGAAEPAAALCGGKRVLEKHVAKCCDADGQEWVEGDSLKAETKAPAECEDDEVAYLASRTVDELWDEIHANGAKLLELQRVQRDLFKRMRAFRETLCEPEGALE